MAARHLAVSRALREAIGDPAQRGALTRLAQALDVTPASVSRWYQLESSPDPALWPAIEQALGLPSGALREAGGAGDQSVAELQVAVTQLAAEVARLSDLVQAHERRLALLDADSARKPSARRARADG